METTYLDLKDLQLDQEKQILLIRRLAFCLHKRLPQGAVDVNDLIQAGWEGLLLALKNYDPARSASFYGYAILRARGAMLDWLRLFDDVPRSVRKKLRTIQTAKNKLENESGTIACHEAIANDIGMELNEYFAAICDGSKLKTSPTDLPPPHIEINDYALDLVDFLDSVTAQEKDVFCRYYVVGETLVEIGKAYGFTEGRACQIRQAVDSKLEQHFKGVC